MGALDGKVAVVTGASRGVGRGVAVGLGEAGATVYVTGRSLHVSQAEWPGTLTETAEAVNAAGGHGIALAVDHRDDAQVAAAFEQVLAEQGKIDILVNNAWGGYEHMVEGDDFTWPRPFWEQPLWRWDAMFASGVRAAYAAAQHAARVMVAQQSGLIVNISYWAAQKFLANTAYGVAKAATDKLAADMAHELRPFNVAAVSLYPGLVRTEGVMANAEFFDMSNSESPQFIGRCVAALALDPALMDRSGGVYVAAALALEYGFTDIDGKQPRPLTVDEA